MNDEKYRVIPKPDYVTYDMIADVLRDAHMSNVEKGMHFVTAESTGKEICEHIGQNGKLYVVINEKEDLCAVGAIKYRTWNKWFCKDQLCGDLMLIGVRESYKGKGLSKLLLKKLEKEAFEKCCILTMNTATDNVIMINSRLHDDWKVVDYFSHVGTDFYSIMLAKWKDECPYSPEYCSKMFKRRKALVKMVRAKNGEYRLWVKVLKKHM